MQLSRKTFLVVESSERQLYLQATLTHSLLSEPPIAPYLEQHPLHHFFVMSSVLAVIGSFGT